MSHYIDIDDVKFPNIATFNMKLSGKQAVMVRLEELKMIPAADVRPVVQGKWIKLDMRKGLEQYKCSVCRSEGYVPECMGEPMYDYCPNCGADMRGEQDG